MLDVIEISKKDALYPDKLRSIRKSPERIYAIGNLNLLNEKSFSVVGTRTPTDYGKKYCRKICKEMSLRDIPIVSGMALGIDTIAHQTALKNGGKTIAVLPCGMNKIYPKENEKLFEQIIENDGLIITEYENDKKADSKKFLERNRLVVALGEGLFVVEALYRSGTSVTARIATEHNKKVFALPGSLDSTYSYGTNNLIKNGAYLVMEAEDIFFQFPEFFSRQIKKYKKNQLLGNSEFQTIYSILSEEPKTADKIALMTRMSVREVSQKLILMEIEGLISHDIGKGFVIKGE